MPYDKLNPLLWLVCLLFTSNLWANSLLQSDSELKVTLMNHYNVLNKKVSACNSLKERPTPSVSEPWLTDLPEKNQRAVFLVVNEIAMARCYKQEEVSYTMALINYTAETGDSSYLDDWINTKKNYLQTDTVLLLRKLDRAKIYELSERENLFFPFNPFTIPLSK
ncbi:hypothetical protein [Photobacterium lipolyticum]|nr:hypothetical protein [Photobacterium lipolyticum]